MNTIRTIVGCTYVVTTSTECTVSTVEGVVIATCPAGLQTSFVAPAERVIISNDSARVTGSFNSASPTAAGGGSASFEFDDVPTAGSDNAITSNGVYAAFVGYVDQSHKWTRQQEYGQPNRVQALIISAGYGGSSPMIQSMHCNLILDCYQATYPVEVRRGYLVKPNQNLVSQKLTSDCIFNIEENDARYAPLSTLPTGSIVAIAGAGSDGFLMCDGREVSRSDFSELYDVIGTQYGNGDGASTFNLPLLSDLASGIAYYIKAKVVIDQTPYAS